MSKGLFIYTVTIYTIWAICRFRGVGIRIEDNLVITADGVEILNKDCSKETDGIEKLTGCK